MIHKDTLVPLKGFFNSSQVSRKAASFPFSFLIKEILIVLSSFLIGRAVLMNQLAPFGTALFAVLLYRKQGGFSAFLAVTAGLLSYQFGGFIWRYLVAMLLFASIWTWINTKPSKWSVFRTAYTLSLCLLVVNTVFFVINGFLAYEILLGLCESIVGFVMVYVFDQAVGFFQDYRYRHIVSGEEMICICIFLSLLIIGFWDVNLLGLSLRNTISISMVLLFAYIGGTGAGAAIGLTVGFMLSLASGPDPVIIGNLAVCGLLAGIFKELGRPGSSIAFLLTNILMTFYINKSAFVILPFWDIVGAFAILMLTPKKSLYNLKKFFDQSWARLDEEQHYGRRVQELTVGRLEEFSRVFHHLSKVFGRISERKAGQGHEDMSQLFDLIAGQVCRGCPLYRSCWERDFYNTYNNIFDLVTTCENKGFINKEDIPRSFYRRCLNVNSLIEDLNIVYNTYRSNLNWQQRINECRQLVADQLAGVSQVVTQLASELNMDMRFKKGMEDTIKLELDRNGIHVKEVLVLEKPGGKLEVSIIKSACQGQKECLTRVEDIVSRIAGKPMSRQNRECIQGGREDCTLTFMEARQFEVITGIVRKPKQESLTCGDSYSFTSIKDGKYLLALSDGMGFGAKAAEESSAVISLLEHFLEAGFDQNITIKTINSILMLRSREEMFATVDLCIMDLVEGNADFIKIGGVPSFILREDKVEIIRQTALPIGILNDIELDNISVQINDEDMIIMVTDGILDAFSAAGDGEKSLANFIASLDTSNPQELADSIMDEALFHMEGEAKDDMTVMAGRVWKPL